MNKLMTREEFIEYAYEALSDEVLESLYETIAEHNNEVAAFGDSWPGALVDIHSRISEVKGIERQLARLQGRPERNFRFTVMSPR